MTDTHQDPMIVKGRVQVRAVLPINGNEETKPAIYIMHL
jgi:hypothetical protein